MLRRIYFIGFAAYILMLVLSLLFYKERTIFLDAAFNLFYIINKKWFTITIYRFGNVLSQLPPLFAARSGFQLDTIFQLYSVAFVLYYFTAYFICGSILKRYDFAIVILLLNILFASHTFYWMLSELPQAIAILMIVFALVSYKPLKAIRPLAWGLLLVALVTVIFFHPLILFVLGFSLLFFMLGNYAIVDKRICYAIVVIYVCGVLVKFLFFKTPYEAHSMSGLKNFYTHFPDYFTLFSNRRFLHNCLSKYYWLPVLFATIVAYYYKTKAWQKLGLFVAGFICYLMLVNISYPTAITPEFYIENLYLPLGIFIALPLVFDLLPMLEKRKVAMPLFILILLTGAIRLYATHPVYTARLDYERKILDEYGERKVIINATKNDSDVLLMTWGTPYEFLLLSESERHRPASIIIDEKPELRIWAGSRKQALVVNYNIVPYSDLNHRYFQFTDTSSIYAILKNR